MNWTMIHFTTACAPPHVLEQRKGIYENLGMINLVYTYSKGLEVLVLPLSGTPTYGFVLPFFSWCTVGILLLAADIVGRYRERVKESWQQPSLAYSGNQRNMAYCKAIILRCCTSSSFMTLSASHFGMGNRGRKAVLPKIYPGFPWLSAPTC